MPSFNDRNAAEIVSALRTAGATVQFIEFQATRVGGCPDLLVGFNGVTYLVEVKSPKGRLSDAQVDFIAQWRGGPIAVVRDVADALAAIGLDVKEGIR